MPVLLALDWDGTVTERDTLHMVIERFGDLEVFRAMEQEIGRQLALDEVIAVEMATISEPLVDVVRWLLEHVRVRPGLAELADAHAPVVVSAGFHELIEPVLEREGIVLPVVANRLDPRPDGWQALFRERAACAVCGEPCKRVDLAGQEPYTYVGDGISDRCAALAAERVFARDGLATWLGARGVAYEPFETLHDVLAAL
jgi:2-hydroxy-3-keto-5-methylthiopentenyl-1-phosphate phosphatase